MTPARRPAPRLVDNKKVNVLNFDIDDIRAIRAISEIPVALGGGGARDRPAAIIWLAMATSASTKGRERGRKGIGDGVYADGELDRVAGRTGGPAQGLRALWALWTLYMGPCVKNDPRCVLLRDCLKGATFQAGLCRAHPGFTSWAGWTTKARAFLASLAPRGINR